ncbi:MAG TPA: hypothetical protein VEQ85_15130 [Lacipirellulaceae bacterium]|nr:hypothetical protein [Lacipirellulaceae bacterium]
MNDHELVPAGRPPRGFLRHWCALLAGPGVSLAWAVNAAALAGLLTWIACDPQFMEPLFSVDPDSPQGLLTIPMSSGRWKALLALATVAALTFGAMALGLFVATRRRRTVRAWLLFLTAAAAWCAVFASWRDLQWAGRTWRAGRLTSEFERFAAPLRSKWPTDDGASQALGPYSAYPIGNPRTLMLLAPPAAPDPFWFGAIERSSAGALRFELKGQGPGIWMEWHPEESRPQDFEGGLDVAYELDRASALGGGWFLTAYRTFTSQGPRGEKVPIRLMGFE